MMGMGMIISPSDNLKSYCGLTYEDTRKVLTYDEMMNLCNSIDNFDYVDEITYGRHTRSFNYRLDILNSFTKIGGRNFRGTTYDIETKELLALPFFKFFNYNQSLFTKDDEVEKWKIKSIYEKVDGSLVYFYIVNGNLVCRTQRSSTNMQSIVSLNIVKRDLKLEEFITTMIFKGYTPMFEFLSPANRLIVRYNFETLCYLGSRNRYTGDILYPNDDHEKLLNGVEMYKNPIISTYPIVENLKTVENVVKECKQDKFNNIFTKLKTFRKYKIFNKIIEWIYNRYRNKVREGYCIVFDNGEIVKVKRVNYLYLFKIKDNMESDKEIVKCLFDNRLDDIISEFKEDPIILSNINTIIECVDDTWNRWNSNAKSFYETNKSLDRKDYAIKANKELNGTEFTIAMNYYSNKHDISIIQQSYIINKLWKVSNHYKKYNNTRIISTNR